MSLADLFILAVGLSMDAFAVSICKGLAMPRASLGKAALVGLWFGGFQALMPLLGYLLGSRFSHYISSVDHWIAFILLGLIGVNMIREAFSEEEAADASLNAREMFMLAVATSIDALAVGVTFAFLNVRILPAVSFIGVTTFVLSAAGVAAGHVLGGRFEKRAQIAGGVILILIGCRILLSHLGLIA